MKGRIVGAVLATALLGGCTTAALEEISTAPEIMPTLATTMRLERMPAPERQMVVAIYGFQDQTGQRKPSEKVAHLSTAVTQGGAAILADAAFRAGMGSWFEVVERSSLPHLLQERQLIRATRTQFGDESPLPALRFAGILLEGGIISYDTNMLTGGLGARLLGIGAHAEYRADVVSIYLRALSTKTGVVVQSVNVSKTLYSVQLQGSVFKFIGLEQLLEIDAGITSNEPTQIAVRQAIESAIYALIMEGALDGLWEFSDKTAGQRALQDYQTLNGVREARHESPTQFVRNTEPAPVQTSQVPAEPIRAEAKSPSPQPPPVDPYAALKSNTPVACRIGDTIMPKPRQDCLDSGGTLRG